MFVSDSRYFPSSKKFKRFSTYVYLPLTNQPYKTINPIPHDIIIKAATMLVYADFIIVYIKHVNKSVDKVDNVNYFIIVYIKHVNKSVDKVDHVNCRLIVS